MYKALARALSHRVPARNPRTVCPPGALPDVVLPLPLVVVASFPGAGAHLLIDFVLNNFPAYRRNPLYVDLDEYLRRGLPVQELLRVGGYVLKTHHPEPHFSSQQHDAYEAIFEQSIVIMPSRSPTSISRSYQRMFNRRSQVDLPEALERFNAFWTTRPKEAFGYGEVSDPDNAASLAHSLEGILNLKPRQRIIPPPTKRHPIRVSMSKLATRLFGSKAPRVNTSQSSSR